MSAIPRFICANRIQTEHLLVGSPPQVPLDATGFRVEYEGMLRQYSWDTQLRQLNFLGTHDTARFRSLCGEDEQTVKLATELLFALPGSPCIYYGDEVGMRGGVPPASRGGFPESKMWNMHTLDTHRRLIHLRRTTPAIQSGAISFVRAERSLLIFDRIHNDSVIRVVVNANDSPVTIEMPTGSRCLYGGTDDGTISSRSAAFFS